MGAGAAGDACTAAPFVGGGGTGTRHGRAGARPWPASAFEVRPTVGSAVVVRQVGSAGACMARRERARSRSAVLYPAYLSGGAGGACGAAVCGVLEGPTGLGLHGRCCV